MTTPLSVSVVTPGHLDAIWSQLLPKIKEGLSHGQGDAFTAESLKAAVRCGDMHLWVAHEDGEVVAGMIFEVVQYPAVKKIFIQMVAGRDMSVWFDANFPLLLKYRDLNEAGTIEASCRDGLVRFLEQRGWKRKAVIMQAPQ